MLVSKEGRGYELLKPQKLGHCDYGSTTDMRGVRMSSKETEQVKSKLERLVETHCFFEWLV